MLSRLRAVPPWVVFLGFGVAAIVAYRLAPLLGVSELARNVLYWTLDASAVVVLLLGVRLYRPNTRWPWWLLAIGQLSALFADITFYGASLIDVTLPYPSVADLLYLLQYPLAGAALFLLIRRRTPGWDLPSLIDASIVAVAAGLLSWVYLISPGASGGGLSTAGVLATAAYPVGDLVLLSVGARLMLGAGSRPPAFGFLAAGFALVLVPDTLYTWQIFAGTYTEGGWLETLWMGSWILLGAAGLHPSMRELSEKSAVAAPDAGFGRMLLLASASLLAPATLLVQYLRQAPLHVPLVAVVCAVLFLLVLARMGQLVAAQRRVAITDGLTGLRTRRYFEEALSALAERAMSGPGLAVLLLDVDRFKSVNDTYGHHGGDRVLCEISRRLTEAVRPGDLVARYGGEEFAVLLPSVTPREARLVADRVHQAIRRTPIAVNSTTGATVTASVGVATLPVDAPDPESLMMLADQLLYTAKEGGRDRVAVGASLAAVPATEPEPELVRRAS
ncbi:GGDEF domain-containing protein [Cryptosporangium aurantiacum]|uniref:Diguanylate cyclase (GGDEF) domain-containing protein n=1 Tax=Cryptosporangium aurantiacum TaxID=134849 RepID=A0A1M7TWC3_9ACTN|nr:GGDEF domain-containing protein [Cryptosporangium aurantiacum]SHN75049.1 diguanylate cyclase (GGDEF) domain-containing protein [Cryptosporangium aurantiacum]